MSAKIISIRSAVFIACAGGDHFRLHAGRSARPAQGQKIPDQGDSAAAVAQLKTATTLLPTNAAAWNYYGVALQRAGQPAEAAAAYQTALKFNRDLVEAHFNLGSLWLEQNRPDAASAAKAEFNGLHTAPAQTRRRAGSSSVSAQLKLGEIVPAEKKFQQGARVEDQRRGGFQRLRSRQHPARPVA